MLQPNQPMGTPNTAATGPQGAKPQQPQMPAGQMLSGVASGGLGSILDSVARPYAGNPQALEQKGMSGDLLAALAAQRLKSQKEHALQQLQLQAAGQQGGQPQKTVVEQNEDALLELTKQEMTQEQADTLKQKQGQMQEGQKRLMQQAMQQAQPGIAGIPAPNVAEPKAMAAGGIVAFADGGDTGGYDIGGGDYTPSSGSGLMGGLPQLRSQSPEEQARINALLEKYRGKINYQQARAVAEGRMSEDEIVRPVATTQPGAQPGANVQPKPTPDAAAGVKPPQQKPPVGADIRPPAEAQGLGGIPGRNTAMNEALTSALKTNPAEATAAERKSAYEFMKPDEADVAARREGLASLQALNKEYNDPDKRRINNLIKTLAVGPASDLAGVGAALGRNAVRADEEDYAQRLLGIGNEEKMRKGIMADIYAPKKEAVGAGTQAGAQASGLLGHALSSAAHTYIGELQAAAQRDIASAQREGINAQKAMTLLASVTNNREKARAKLMEDLPMNNPDYMLLSKDFTKLSSSEQRRALEAKKKFEAVEAQALGGFDRMISSLEAQLGYNKGTSSGAGKGAVNFADLPK